MPATSRRSRLSKATADRLISRVVEADRTPAALAAELGLSLPALAAWAADPATLAVLESLARLADIRTQMLVSQFRANAAIQLIQIASASEPTELSRKACVDLLSADLDAFEPGKHEECLPSRGRQPSAPSEAAILRALEQLGRDDLDSPPAE